MDHEKDNKSTQKPWREDHQMDHAQKNIHPKRRSGLSRLARFDEDTTLRLNSTPLQVEFDGATYESEPPPMKWSAPMIRKAEDLRWPLRDPSLK
ncbi:hypothetical protein, partial [Parasedimentitalea huanghaiensis]|uniref:hypothetical protein n=1 Tax=Parasedimentitalea huanghaiensis TaxID=2682100 RepID=UPI001ADD23B0